MYTVVAPGLKGIYGDPEVTSKIMALYPYTKFRKSQTEEECQAFLERYGSNRGIEEIRDFGDTFDKHHAAMEYFIRSPNVYFSYDTNKLGTLRLIEDTAIIRNRTDLVRAMILNLIVDRESISRNIIAIYNDVKLLGDSIDVEAVVPDHPIFYAIRSYTGNNRAIARLKDYLKVRPGKVSVTLRRRHYLSADTMNKNLRAMRAAGKVVDIKVKGTTGEAAASDIAHEYHTKHGGILKRGFIYPYASNRQGQVYLGNISWDEEKQKFYDITKQLNDEIDISYISDYRVFATEVRSYHDKTIVVMDKWMERQGKKVEKSPFAQAEKHVGHLYHQLYGVLPFGDPRYTVPIVCFIDESTIDEQRSDKIRYYLPMIVFDNLKQLPIDRDLPVDTDSGYTLDLDMIEKKLKFIERERDL